MSPVYRSFMMFDLVTRKKMIKISFLQLILGALDLLGVAVIGVIGALSVTGVKSGLPGGRLNAIISLINLDNFSFQTQIAILSIFAVFLLVTKTVVSAVFTKRIFQYLGKQGAELSTQIMKALLCKSILFTKSRNIQELIYMSSSGTNALSIGVIGGAITLVADFSLTIVIGCALLFVDPIIAIVTFILFGLVLHTLNRATQEKSTTLGKNFAEYSIQSNNLFDESLKLFREIKLSNHKDAVILESHHLRTRLSSTAAEIAFLPNLSKYVIESSILIGALLLSAFQFLAQDSSQAVATLAVFIAAGTRIAPALLRIQQGLLVIRNSSGTALSTIELIRDLQSEPDNSSEKLEKTEIEFLPQISAESVSFRFPNSNENLFSNLSFKINPGSRVAIVGPSGSGKSTLVDILLGILPPSSGVVHISGIQACDASLVWPGLIGYVPQDVWLIDGSIKENILLGWEGVISDFDLESIVKQAQLSQNLVELSSGLDTIVGAKGQSLSGGQRQRIGIARALLTKPKLLVLDEATSALDSSSENLISNSISKLDRGTTVIMIAHRLVSIKNFDRVIYLDNGTILADGSFADVRSQIPDFDNQADLLGLQ
jgi:ABC-type multidrug transport system fused ATPase/permease subunit